MVEIDLEREYDNRGRVPEHPAIIAGWYAAAAVARSELACELDIAYGPHPGERLDVFTPARPAAGAAVLFVHGGYWQALDKDGFGHVARGPLAHGLPVAVAGYPLCPAVPLARIVEAIRAAVVATHRRTSRPVVVCGHSAGGHLAACMLATDWTAHEASLPAGVVPAALAISGIFDLVPLTRTKVNDALGLDEATARALSPVAWTPPPRSRFDAWLGAEESGEYHRQSRDIVRAWGLAAVDTEYQVLAGADHFTAIAPLSEPDSALTRRLAAFAKGAPATSS